MYLIFFFFLPLSFLSFINKSKIYVVGSCPSTGLYISVLSRFLWQYPFASLAPHLSTLSVSIEIAVGSFVSQKLAGIGSRSPLSIRRALFPSDPRISERSDKWGSNLCEKKSFFPRFASFIRINWFHQVPWFSFSLFQFRKVSKPIWIFEWIKISRWRKKMLFLIF